MFAVGNDEAAPLFDGLHFQDRAVIGYFGDRPLLQPDMPGGLFIATAGLSGPVGMAIDQTNGELCVVNCIGKTIARIGRDGLASVFAKGDLLKCPNGIVFDSAGMLML